MPDHGPDAEPYAIKFSPSGRESRNSLPQDVLSVLFGLLDELGTNPDAYPGRVRRLGVEGKVRLYCHPSPSLEVTFEIDTEHRILYLWHFVAPKAQITKPVFISYSRKDAKWLIKLKQFLQPLEDRD